MFRSRFFQLLASLALACPLCAPTAIADDGGRRVARPIDRALPGTRLVPLSMGTLEYVAAQFGLPLGLLMAVLKTEGGKVGECLGNVVGDRVGSWDCGPYQVNTVHLPALSAVLGEPEYLVRQRLRDDGRFNATVAGWLLSDAMHRTGRAGSYHSRTPALRETYERQLVDAMSWLDRPLKQSPSNGRQISPQASIAPMVPPR